MTELILQIIASILLLIGAGFWLMAFKEAMWIPPFGKDKE